MKKIKLIYTPKHIRIVGCDPLDHFDPLAMKNTIAIKAEVAGKKYGFFLELEDEETTVETVVQVLQVWLDKLETLEREAVEPQEPRPCTGKKGE